MRHRSAKSAAADSVPQCRCPPLHPPRRGRLRGAGRLHPRPDTPGAGSAGGRPARYRSEPARSPLRGWLPGLGRLGAAAGQPLWARPAGRGRAERVDRGHRAEPGRPWSLVLALELGRRRWPPLVALAGLGGLAAAPTSPISRTLWPQLADDEHRPGRPVHARRHLAGADLHRRPGDGRRAGRASGPSAALLAAAACGAVGGLVFAYRRPPAVAPHPEPSVGLACGSWLSSHRTPHCSDGVRARHDRGWRPAAAILDGNRAPAAGCWRLERGFAGRWRDLARDPWHGGPAQRMAADCLVVITIGTAARGRRLAVRARLARCGVVPRRSGPGAIAGRRLRRDR